MEFFELFYSYYKQDFLEKRIREGEEEKRALNTPGLLVFKLILGNLKPDSGAFLPTIRSSELPTGTYEPAVPSSELPTRSSEPAIRSSEPAIRSSEPAIRSSEPAIRSSEPAIRSSELPTPLENPVFTIF